MTWRLVKPILILPGNVVVVIPALILWAAGETWYGAAAPSVRDVTLWLGLATAVPALGLIPKLVDIDSSHGGKSARPGRRGAKRDARPSGERRNEPGGPICPTEGRGPKTAQCVAACLWWTGTTAQPASVERSTDQR